MANKIIFICNIIFFCIISLGGVFAIDYISEKKFKQNCDEVINEKDSCIYELNEKLLMQNIEVENYKDSIIIYKDSINSLINELDSVNEELQINKIKIERIREYNRIAAQGNNIKFLRGWINRVIN